MRGRPRIRRLAHWSAVTAPVDIRLANDSDRSAWTELYAAYAASGEVVADADQIDRVWGWLRSSRRAPCCFVAVIPGVGIVGFAHWRPFEIPILGSESLYIDDLFVNPGHRGSGIARLLIDSVRHEAGRRESREVRWTSRPDNTSAVMLYDRIATRSDAIIYNATPIAGELPTDPGRSGA